MREDAFALQDDRPTSCGTLVIDRHGRLLVCHVTGKRHWDIPKGMRERGESSLAAAQRELLEETGLAFDAALFEELGSFDYRSDKRLHLYRVRAPDSLSDLSHLHCASCFPHPVTAMPTPEMDDFRWATRDEVNILCSPRMARQLLALDW